MAPQTIQIRRIAKFYHLYFLYFEPLAALGGTYLCIFDPERFLKGTVPATTLIADPIAISPIVKMLLINIGVLYTLFAINEGITLRLTRDKAVWFTVMAAMLTCDIGHIYAVYAADPSRILQFSAWSSDEWINYGTLLGGSVLRVLFLLGIGRS